MLDNLKPKNIIKGISSRAKEGIGKIGGKVFDVVKQTGRSIAFILALAPLFPVSVGHANNDNSFQLSRRLGEAQLFNANSTRPGNGGDTGAQLKMASKIETAVVKPLRVEPISFPKEIESFPDKGNVSEGLANPVATQNGQQKRGNPYLLGNISFTGEGEGPLINVRF